MGHLPSLSPYLCQLLREGGAADGLLFQPPPCQPNLRPGLKRIYQHSIDTAAPAGTICFCREESRKGECVGWNSSPVGPGGVGGGRGWGEAGFLAAATGQRENAFTEALRLELIPCTVDESFLLELLTYSTYCDNFTTTRADLKGPVILGALM